MGGEQNKRHGGSGALHRPGVGGRLEAHTSDPSNVTNDSSEAPEREGAWLKVTQCMSQWTTFPQLRPQS